MNTITRAALDLASWIGSFGRRDRRFYGKAGGSSGIAAQAAVEMGCNVADGVNKRTTILVIGDQDLRRTKGNEKAPSTERRRT